MKSSTAWSARGVGGRAGFPGVNPLGTGARHKLNFPGEAPGLFEKQIGAPFGRMAAEKRRDAGFKFEPVFDRSDFHGDGGAEAGCSVLEIPRARSAKFEYGGGFLSVGLLRNSRGRSKQERGDDERFCQGHDSLNTSGLKCACQSISVVSAKEDTPVLRTFLRALFSGPLTRPRRYRMVTYYA